MNKHDYLLWLKLCLKISIFKNFLYQEITQYVLDLIMHMESVLYYRTNLLKASVVNHHCLLIS